MKNKFLNAAMLAASVATIYAASSEGSQEVAVLAELSRLDKCAHAFISAARTDHIRLMPSSVRQDVFMSQLSDHYPFNWTVAGVSGFTWNILAEGGWGGFMDSPYLCNRFDGKIYGAFTPGRSNKNVALSCPRSQIVLDRHEYLFSVLSDIAFRTGILCLQEVSLETTEAYAIPFVSNLKDQISHSYGDAYLIATKKCFSDDWTDGEGHKTAMDYGIVTVVDTDKYDVAEITIPEDLKELQRGVLVSLRKKTDGEGVVTRGRSVDVYLLNVHLAYENPSKVDVYSGLTGELTALRARLNKPLIVTGDFNRDIRNIPSIEHIAVLNGSVVADPAEPLKIRTETNDGVMVL